MLHIDNPNVGERLLSGNFGLEKESLRVNADGSMAHSPHPFHGNDHVVRDFCENQTEINTTVYKSAEQALNALWEHTKEIQKVLAGMENPEYLWPFSNPPFILNEADIPIAQFEGEDAEKTRYREYLSDRYGRYKMTFSGIHVNFSFSEELLKADFELSEESDYRTYKDQLYVKLAEQAAAYSWIVTAITASSPVLDSSYLEKGKVGGTTFNGMSSTRCSELGYWNYFTPLFDYTDIQKYADSIQKYVDYGMIAAPSELYYPIRLKPPGKNDLNRLRENGVSHIELRMVDLNPYEKSGLDIRDLKFIQLLLVWLAGSEHEPLTLKSQVQAAQNFKHASHYDLKTVKIVSADGEVCSVAKAGRKVIDKLREFYAGYPADIIEILDYEEDKFINPEHRYSWRLRHEYAENYAGLGLELAKKKQEEALAEG